MTDASSAPEQQHDEPWQGRVLHLRMLWSVYGRFCYTSHLCTISNMMSTGRPAVF